MIKWTTLKLNRTNKRWYLHMFYKDKLIEKATVQKMQGWQSSSSVISPQCMTDYSASVVLINHATINTQPFYAHY